MAPLMLLMKANKKVPCLELHLEKKLLLQLVLLMILMKEINWILQMTHLTVIIKSNLTVLFLELF